MPRIIVDPADLRILAAAIRRETAELENITARLNSSLYRLDWRLRAKYPIENEWHIVKSRINAVRAQAEHLVNTLYFRAEKFENAELESNRSLVAINVPKIFVPFLYILPTPDLKKFLRLSDEEYRPYSFPVSTLTVITLSIMNGLIKEASEDEKSWGHIVSLCNEALKKLSPGTKSIPWIGMVAGTFLDYAAGKDYSERGLRVAVGKNLIEMGIATSALGTGVLIGNAVVQVGGKALINGSEWLGKQKCVEPMHDLIIERSAERAVRAIEKLDLGNITEDISKIANDIYIEPTINAWRDAWTMLVQDVRSLAFHAGDFVMGAVTTPFELARHGMTITLAAATEEVKWGLPHDLSKHIAGFNESLLVGINSIGEIPRFEELIH